MSMKRFEADDIVTANATEVTMGLWPGDTGSLVLLYTGSQATPVSKDHMSGDTSGEYYWNIFNLNPHTESDLDHVKVCFAVAYGDRTGRGHPTLEDSDTSTLSPMAVYSQYRNLLLDPGDTQFTFYGGVNSDNIYIMNVSRDLFKERVDPGNWLLHLSGTNGEFKFIDDSGQALGSAFGKSGQVFNIVSGTLSGVSGSSIATGSQRGGYGSTASGGYGLFYPSLGIMVFNPAALNDIVGFIAPAQNNWSGSVNPTRLPFQPYVGSTTVPQYNHAALLYSMILGTDVQARSAENITSTHYFVRLRAKDYNYSNNPTFFDEANGSLVYSTFIQDPRAYVTTIGLYSDANELLAVAKTSKPIQKGFDKEVNLKVRLDY